MSHVPLPFRVAMGLVVTAVEQARKLPEQLAEFPITAASRAVQAGMRVQQRVTELAIKGDQVFSLFRPVEDTPAWARFDEDDEPHQPGTDAGASTVGESSKINDWVVVVPDHDAGLAPEPASLAPAALPEYDELSLAQLRGKLRGLSLPQLAALLDYEHLHQDRPAFLTLLSNRISTVRSHPTESP
ncbi:MAG: lipid droplet-associated protein [Pseudonocardiales bacterium]|nr:lipid droplet-associated protein [Pseudonocardiales bacterium]